MPPQYASYSHKTRNRCSQSDLAGNAPWIPESAHTGAECIYYVWRYVHCSKIDTFMRNMKSRGGGLQEVAVYDVPCPINGTSCPHKRPALPFRVLNGRRICKSWGSKESDEGHKCTAATSPRVYQIVYSWNVGLKVTSWATPVRRTSNSPWRSADPPREFLKWNLNR